MPSLAPRLLLVVLVLPSVAWAEERTAPRRPVALGRVGQMLLVANRSGTVMRVDPTAGQVREELRVGRRLADLVVLVGEERALVVDEEAHELIAIDCAPAAPLKIRARLSVAAYPVEIVASSDGRRVFVASLWSRRITAVELDFAGAGKDSLRVAYEVPLPFAPRKLVALSDDRLLAADSFGGGLAVIDLSRGRLEWSGELPGHNIRGLSLSPDGRRVLVAHQVLDERLATGLGELRSGKLTSGALRVLDRARLIAGDRRVLAESELVFLGTVGNGAADPGEIAWDRAGRMIIALSGVHEAAVFTAALGNADEPREPLRLKTGMHPTSLAASADGSRVYVAATLDDSITVLDPAAGRVVATISLGKTGPLHPRDRGERLFFDATLSQEGWLSCHSCHTDGHTNGRLADTLGDDTFSTPKRVLSLLGTVNTGPWGWNGKQQDLYEQIEKSVVSTMHGLPMDRRDSSDLATFLLSLEPAPPAQPAAATPGDRAAIGRGQRIFERRECGKCHVPTFTYSAFESFDVGLSDEVSLRKFNPPSLRGVGHGARFFHDNRAATLEDIFTRHAHPTDTDLPPADLADLVRFLKSL